MTTTRTRARRRLPAPSRPGGLPPRRGPLTPSGPGRGGVHRFRRSSVETPTATRVFRGRWRRPWPTTEAMPSGVTSGPSEGASPVTPATAPGPGVARTAGEASSALAAPRPGVVSAAGEPSTVSGGGLMHVLGRARLAGRIAEAGAATAEYAMVLVVAAAFSSLLIKIITSGAVKGLLTGLVTRALS